MCSSDLIANLLTLAPTLYMLQVFDRVMHSQNEFTLIAVTLILVLFLAVMAFLNYAGGSSMLLKATTGLLAAVGLAVRRGVACHGAFVSVSPAPDVLPLVHAVPAACRTADVPALTMGSIEGDLQRHVRPQDVRTALVHDLAAAFAFPRTLVQAGFPVPPPAAGRTRAEVTSRVG